MGLFGINMKKIGVTYGDVCCTLAVYAANNKDEYGLNECSSSRLALFSFSITRALSYWSIHKRFGEDKADAIYQLMKPVIVAGLSKIGFNKAEKIESLSDGAAQLHILDLVSDGITQEILISMSKDFAYGVYGHEVYDAEENLFFFALICEFLKVISSIKTN